MNWRNGKSVTLTDTTASIFVIHRVASHFLDFKRCDVGKIFMPGLRKNYVNLVLGIPDSAASGFSIHVESVIPKRLWGRRV